MNWTDQQGRLCRPGMDAHGFMFGLCPDCAAGAHTHHHGATECAVDGCACEECDG